MTVEQLIRELQDMPEDAEVRLAQQPAWPFEYSLDTVAATEPGEGYEVVFDNLDDDGDAWWVLDPEGNDRGGDPCDGPFKTSAEAEAALNERLARDGETEPVVYIGEGTQLRYLPQSARRALGWS